MAKKMGRDQLLDYIVVVFKTIFFIFARLNPDTIDKEGAQ